MRHALVALSLAAAFLLGESTAEAVRTGREAMSVFNSGFSVTITPQRVDAGYAWQATVNSCVKSLTSTLDPADCTAATVSVPDSQKAAFDSVVAWAITQAATQRDLSATLPP